MQIYLIFVGILVSSTAWAYPQFIGYKYSSCLTCHYNSQGNGPINDYGRALWSAEIAGKLWNASDEKLGEASGFLGTAQLPWWVRPGFKSRFLAFEVDPPAGKTKTVLMQAEANLALFFDKDQDFGFIGSYGYVPVPMRLKNQPDEPDEWISREHYFRLHATENLWVSIGMMDKVYGIRIANHTAYSRAMVGVAQNDQSHGVMAHYIKPEWEATVHGFVGNLFQDAEYRQKGASTLVEYELKEAWRIGVTGLYSANEYVKQMRFGVLNKYGFSHGSALLFELGAIQNSPKKGGDFKSGYYMYSEAIQRLTRGYHLSITAQLYKDDMGRGRPDNLTTGIGLLMFPMARTEFRLEAENGRQMSNDSEVQNDNWIVMAQMHLSL